MARRIAALKVIATLVTVAIVSPWLVFKDHAELWRFLAIVSSWVIFPIILTPTLVAGAFLLFWREKLEQIPPERLISISSWGHVASYLISFGLIVSYIKMVP